jgi:glycosyltransferase involved in cell wall biosynthesis
MKIVVLPRSSNPFQRLLYDEVERAGHRVRYAGELTPSHTANLLLLPFELVACRLTGWTILHVHWVFGFSLPGAQRFPLLRRVSQAWFSAVLAVCRLSGIRVVWSAHNVLPHGRVFHDEIAARRKLVCASELVIVHAPGALEALDRIGAKPARSAYVQLGPLSPQIDAARLRPPGASGPPLKLLFFGQVLEHKGVEDLLEAMTLVPAQTAVELVVAGECPDPALQARLNALAAQRSDRVTLRLEHVPTDEVTEMMAASDLVVLPFRRLTTSSSTLLAMGHGRGLILPRLEALADLPTGATAFYDGTLEGLREVIGDAAQWSAERLQEMGAAASAYVATLSWATAARETLAAIGAQRQ